MDSFCESMDLYRFVGHESGLKKIRFVLWITNPDLKRFVLYRGSRILTLKDSFRNVNHESGQFSKIHLFLRIQRILSTVAQNESLKIKIREFESLRILKSRIRKSEPLRFVLWIRFWKICFVDLFCANKNLKRFDSFRFVRFSVRIPHP
jgi:hypothetical protein